MALLIGLGLNYPYHDVLAANLPCVPQALAWPLRLGVVAHVFYLPYWATMRHLLNERTSDYTMGTDAHLARYVGQLAHDQPNLDKLTLLYQGGYSGALLFYQMVLTEEGRKNVAVLAGADVRFLQPGAVVLVCEPAYRARFKVVSMHQEATCETLLLLTRK